MKAFFKTLGLLAALQLTACLETVNSDQVVTEVVHQAYEVSYNQDSNSTQVRADYRVGGSMGTTIRLKEPSYVTANGQSLSEDDVFFGNGVKYVKTFPGFVDQVTTHWRDQEGRSYINDFEIRPITLVSAPSNMMTSGTYQIQFIAPGLDSEDQVRVSISQSKENKSHYHSSYVSNPASGVAVIDSSELANFESGTVTISIERVRSLALQETTDEGGYGVARYESRAVSASITNDTGLAPLH